MTRLSQDHARAERLAWARAFGRPLTEDDRGFLRMYAERCPDMSDRVGLVAEAIRRVTHGDPSVATGAERRGLFEEVMVRREGGRASRPRRIPVFGWAGAAAAVVLVAVLLVPLGQEIRTPQAPAEHVAVRGELDDFPSAGLGISGVDLRGSEYEVLHEDGLCPGHALRFYLTVRDEGTAYYALFGVQDLDDPTWYAPVPRDPVSPALPEIPALTWMVPFEVETDGTHVPGPLSVICILSEEPISFPRLEAAWAAADGDDVTSRAAAAVLDAGTIRVLVEEIEILDDCGRRP